MCRGFKNPKFPGGACPQTPIEGNELRSLPHHLLLLYTILLLLCFLMKTLNDHQFDLTVTILLILVGFIPHDIKALKVRNVLLEMRQVALDNMRTQVLKLCRETSKVAYSTENR